MTPEANPIRAFCSIPGRESFSRKTQAAPATVPAKGNNSPKSNPLIRIFLETYRGKDSDSREQRQGENEVFVVDYAEAPPVF